MYRDDLAAGHALRWFNITAEWMARPRAISTTGLTAQEAHCRQEKKGDM